MYQIRSALLSHPGRKRHNNEDFAVLFEPEDATDLNTSGRIYIVADGVGGAAQGEKASQYAAQKVMYEYYRFPDLEPGERLERFMEQASHDIHSFAANNDQPMRMATTMVAAVVCNDLLTVANVGDSRAYLIRDGAAHQITNDHSLVGELVRSGEMTEEEAMRSRIKNRITRSLGGHSDVAVDTFRKIPLKIGDKVILCSDGLTRYAANADIVRLTAEGNPEQIVGRLVDYANQSGGADNVSVILLSVEAAQQQAASLERTVRIMPQKVEWDTLSPARPARSGSQPALTPWQSARLHYRLPLILGSAAVILVSVCAILALLYISPGWFEKIPVTATATAAQSVQATPAENPAVATYVAETEVASSITAQAAANIAQPASPTQAAPPTEPLPPAVPLTNTPPPLTATPVTPLVPQNAPQQPAPGQSEGQMSLVTCEISIPISVKFVEGKYVPVQDIQNMYYVYQILKGSLDINYVVQILDGKRFVSYDDFAQDYAPRILCSDKNQSTKCDYNPGLPHVQWGSGWMLFPDISSENCKEYGGTPIIPSQQ